ncbi:L-dopachrome tautomerase-related protein [Enterobacter asburiae]|uniref:L-dopachrome tautomerase-related protein n=1 Tax=Enterobacter asburiae TaxID=61645 RepID=UPI003896C032
MTLFFHGGHVLVILAGSAVPTAILRQPASTDAQITEQIRDLGTVGSNTDGIVTDEKGNLYITDVTRSGIVRYDPNTLSMSLIAASEDAHWPDTPAIRPNGDLIFTSSSLNDHFAGAVKSGEECYDLWRLPLNASKDYSRVTSVINIDNPFM